MGFVGLCRSLATATMVHSPEAVQRCLVAQGLAAIVFACTMPILVGGSAKFAAAIGAAHVNQICIGLMQASAEKGGRLRLPGAAAVLRRLDRPSGWRWQGPQGLPLAPAWGPDAPGQHLSASLLLPGTIDRRRHCHYLHWCAVGLVAPVACTFGHRPGCPPVQAVVGLAVPLIALPTSRLVALNWLLTVGAWAGGLGYWAGAITGQSRCEQALAPRAGQEVSRLACWRERGRGPRAGLPLWRASRDCRD